MSRSLYMRGSWTRTVPRWVEGVALNCPTCWLEPVAALKRLVLPQAGNPIIPNFMSRDSFLLSWPNHECRMSSAECRVTNGKCRTPAPFTRHSAFETRHSISTSNGGCAAEDLVFDEDRHRRSHGQGDRIGRAGIDFDDLLAALDFKHRVVGVFDQVVDDDARELAAHLFDDVMQQVVRHRAWNLAVVEFPVDRHRFVVADENREVAVAAALFQDNDLCG